MNVPFFLRAVSDLLTIILLHAVYFLIKYFGSNKWSFFCDDWSIKYPYKNNTISTIGVTLYGYLTPVVVIFLVEVGNALYRKLAEIKVTQLKVPFHSFMTSYNLGRLRPHFWDVCKPNVPMNCTGLQTVYTCEGSNEDLIHDVFLSFMSGHASTASSGVFFTVIYLQARLQVTILPLLRPFFQYALLASLIYVCATRVTDHYHHATDSLLSSGTWVMSSVKMNISKQVVHKTR
ncbi:unnamed protein product [Heterobilharzia americana]|nr:unnamed protein product [Heterobilharzia americana]